MSQASIKLILITFNNEGNNSGKFNLPGFTPQELTGQGDAQRIFAQLMLYKSLLKRKSLYH